MPCCEPHFIALVSAAATTVGVTLSSLFYRRKIRAVKRGPCPETKKAECYCPEAK